MTSSSLLSLFDLKFRYGATAQQQFNIDQQAFALDSIQDTLQTVDTMKETAKVMKKQFKKINVDKVENLQDKIEDLMLDTEEVNQVLSRTYDNVSEADSEELDGLLEGLDEFDLDDELEEEPDYLKDDAMPSNALPTVPQGKCFVCKSFCMLNNQCA